ncbi:trans-sialidase, partial [Trypanosoma rangeli SC58]
MRATKDGKSVLLSMRFTKSKNKWELSYDVTGEGCRDPSIVEWGGDQNLLAMAPCVGGSYDVYESTGAGTDWFGGTPISRVWGTSHDRTGEGVRSGFITANIGGTKVMLLTTPVYSEGAGNEKGTGRLHLWVTDNARVHDVGPVSSEGHDAAASSLLYRRNKEGKEELVLLYEKKNDGDSYSLVALSLTAKLELIKEVVRHWTALDAALRSCTSRGTVDPLGIKNVCKGPIPTKGLVGFLSSRLTDGTGAGKVWKDEYLGVNATVKGETVTSTGRGVTFKGAGAWAEWPVGSNGQNQPYYFANNKFTLVATVTIHAVPGEASSPIPLMGVKMNDTDGTALFEVSYT